jgi:hypothetical protein
MQGSNQQTLRNVAQDTETASFRKDQALTPAV